VKIQAAGRKASRFADFEMYEDENNMTDRSLYFLRNGIPRVNARKQVL
jgi:hypothetical protein